MAVFAPIPSASVSMATAVNPGLFHSILTANLRSCEIVCMNISALSLFIPQNNNRIDERRTTSRQITGHECGCDKNERGRAEHQWIRCAHSKEQARQQSRDGQ